MESSTIKEIHVAGWLLMAGAIVFWIGAFSPPYKQWTSPLREYLEVIAAHRIAWYWIHSCFVIGVLMTLVGCRMLSSILQSEGVRIFPESSFALLLLGSLLWILSIAFRVTVESEVARITIETGAMPTWFEPLHRWSGLMFALYMVLAYLATAGYGNALSTTTLVPGWVGRTLLYFGIAAALGFIVRFPLFAPPLMVHVPFFIAGLSLVRQ